MIHRLKGGHSGEHPLQTDEAKTLKAYLRARKTATPVLFTSNRNDPISRSMLHRLMRAYGKAAELPKDKQHFHVLKHSIATHLLDAAADVRFVQDWLGHANIQNTVIYTYLTSTSREEKARRLFLKLPRY
jgi:type 1 fimbriae regulatory protein FimB